MNTNSLDAQRTPVHRNIYFIAVMCAILVRIAWTVTVPVLPLSDAVIYDRMAKHIALGHGPSLQPLQTPVDQIVHTAYWPVGASAIYGGLYKLFGFSDWPIVTINILANIATIYLAMWLTERWFSRKHALITGLILAFWPAQIMFSTVPASELLFAFFMMAALVTWETVVHKKILRPTATGVLLAAACLIRPTALLVPGLLGLCSLLKGGDHAKVRNLVSGVIVCGLTMLLCILPWSFYNKSQFGQFVLISTNGGPNFWMGNHPGTNGGYTRLPNEVRGMNEIQREQYLKREALGYIRVEPFAFIRRSIIKAFRLHERESIGVSWNEDGLRTRFGSETIIFGIKLIANVYWWVALALAIGGVAYTIFLQPRRFKTLLVPLLFWGYFTAIHAITVIQDRYHFPSVPFIAMLAAIFLASLWESMSKGTLQNSECSFQSPTDLKA
jgi:4-amino-4-deoxy-L-arabinose transferase-like glycosyltransferase